MSEQPERAGLVVRLLVALTVVGLVFGGGVLVGWATRERRPPARSKSAEPVSAEEVKKGIAACRKELRQLAKEQIAPPVIVAQDAAPEEAAKVEALRREVQECRVRETVQNGYVCGTIDGHINLHNVVMTSSSCVEEAGLPEYLLNSVEKCAEFHEFPAHLDEDELTQSEKNRIWWSKFTYNGRTKQNVTGWVEATRRACRKEWALPPE
ncbi:hypothetical protein [Polyangium jinanense]|uniref:Uncharacterized protein n=1 Tax=Polyangium jinanense TaxID=2829994 RepID=A0A9X4AX72_9BACT|nr:hypothetical protein [Polyangium jinanense]MDC3958918.1 hypothetical protein [Polyangium jinanense]MDC3986032.1 hypothetical protein [Polyangium jinanense]